MQAFRNIITNFHLCFAVEAIDYVNAGGRLENSADEALLKQYDVVRVRPVPHALSLSRPRVFARGFCRAHRCAPPQKKLDAVTNVGRAEVARLKELNTESKVGMKHTSHF